MKKIVTEFKDFISRGNVMDMAVGVIVGGAFGKITSSLVNDVFMPFLGWIIGDIDLTALNITLSPAVMEGETVIKEPVVVGIGSFLATIIDFLLIALVVFLFVKAVNTARSKLEKPAEEEAPAAPPEPSNEEKLLTEIRDLLKEKNIPYKEVIKLDDVMQDLDILYMTRVQKERFFNEEDYIRLKDIYILDQEKLNLAKADMPVLHPLPRVDEIALGVDADPRAAYFQQVLNGKFIRMALILSLLDLTDPVTGKKVLVC